MKKSFWSCLENSFKGILNDAAITTFGFISPSHLQGNFFKHAIVGFADLACFRMAIDAHGAVELSLDPMAIHLGRQVDHRGAGTVFRIVKANSLLLGRCTKPDRALQNGKDKNATAERPNEGNRGAC